MSSPTDRHRGPLGYKGLCVGGFLGVDPLGLPGCQRLAYGETLEVCRWHVWGLQI